MIDGVPKQVLVAASFSFWDWYQGKSSDWSSHSTTCLGRSFGKVADRGLDLGLPNLSSFTASAFPLLITLHSVCREVIPVVSIVLWISSAVPAVKSAETPISDR